MFKSYCDEVLNLFHATSSVRLFVLWITLPSIILIFIALIFWEVSSDFILTSKIVRKYRKKANAIMIKGMSIEGSIAGASKRVRLAGWRSVFHQSTENFIIGILTKPTKARIAEALIPRKGFSKAWLRAI